MFVSLALKIHARKLTDRVSFLIKSIGRKIYEFPEESKSYLSYLSPWVFINGDRTLRFHYHLGPESTVVDVGGFEGNWTADIYDLYACKVYCFEPVKAFADKITQRFSHNPRIFVYSVALGGSDRTEKISVIGDRSSTIVDDPSSSQIKVVDTVQFFHDHNIKHIDLIKINIEGGEYELLDNLIEGNYIKNISNIQVQFHNFLPTAKERMGKIQSILSKTHELTFQFPFVWENWTLKT